ncbi:hypothetical protein ABEW77_21035, partial [Heyndrickxia sporothermodurans]
SNRNAPITIITEAIIDMKRLTFCSIICILLLWSCSHNKETFHKRVNTQSSEFVKVYKNKHLLLPSGNKIASTPSPFKIATGFIPNQNFTQYIKIKEESYKIIDNSSDNHYIPGKMIIDNNMSKKITYTIISLQGNQNTKVKTKDGKLHSSLTVTANPNSSTVIPLDIKWDPKGFSELTIFPLRHDGPYLYDGGALALIRLYVKNKNSLVDKKTIKEQAFDLQSNYENSFLPTLSLTGNFTRSMNNNECYTNKKITGIKVNSIPFNAKADVLLLEDNGKTKVLVKNLQIKKNKGGFYSFNTSTLDYLYNKELSKNNRKFIAVFINRNSEILADVQAVNEGIKPYMTTYQGLTEVCKLKKEAGT